MRKKTAALLALLLVLSLALGGCLVRLDGKPRSDPQSDQQSVSQSDQQSVPQSDPQSDRESGTQSETQSEAQGETQPGDMPRFSRIEYRRPDMAAFRALYETLIADLEADRLSTREGVTRLQEAYDAYNDFYTMSTVAELRYHHDITDSRMAEEYDWCLEQEAQVDQLFERLCSASANCGNAEALDEEFWGGWVVEAYRGQQSATLDEAYLDLVRRENALLTEYHRATADPTVLWQGREQSYLSLEQDDSISLEDWEEIQALYYDKYAPILGELYIRLVGVRQELAAYLELDSYEDYVYYADYERDFSPQQAETLLEQIRTELGPLYKELDLNRRWAELEYTELNEAENLEALHTAVRKMGGKAFRACKDMERYELYDIEISGKKADLSYQCYLYSYDNPFVFVKTQGYSDDILNFGHEFGHFVDAWYNHDATSSHDLAEVFSQGMEYLLLSRVPEDYRAELTEYKLLDTVNTFTQQGSFAAFEHEVYARPAAEWTPEALNRLSLELARDYGYLDPEREDYYAKSWIDVSHFFETPFYVVSYCVSNCAAFELYEKECAKADAGLECWSRMLPREHDSFLQTVTEQGGLSDPFAPGRMREVAALLREKLKENP